MTDLELLYFKSIIVNSDINKVDVTSSLTSITLRTIHILIKFAKWIDDSNLHGYSKQVREAMVIYKVDTIEELVVYFMDNVYKLE